MKEEKKLFGAAKIAADKKAAKLAEEQANATQEAPQLQEAPQSPTAPVFTQSVPKEVKIVFAPNSARTVAWEPGLTTRIAMGKAGFQVLESNSERIVTYTIRVNNSVNIDLDSPIAEPNGSTVTFLMITEEIKGN